MISKVKERIMEYLETLNDTSGLLQGLLENTQLSENELNRKARRLIKRLNYDGRSANVWLYSQLDGDERANDPDGSPNTLSRGEQSPDERM